LPNSWIGFSGRYFEMRRTSVPSPRRFCHPAHRPPSRARGHKRQCWLLRLRLHEPHMLRPCPSTRHEQGGPRRNTTRRRPTAIGAAEFDRLTIWWKVGGTVAVRGKGPGLTARWSWGAGGRGRGWGLKWDPQLDGCLVWRSQCGALDAF